MTRGPGRHLAKVGRAAVRRKVFPHPLIALLALAAQADTPPRVEECRRGNQVACVEVAKLHTSARERRAAVLRIEDQAVLAEIATTDEDWHVREAAVRRLAEDAVLAEIATTDPQYMVRGQAVEQLADQALLARIAREDASSYVRRLATERITDPEVLARIAREDEDSTVRTAAVSQLTDPAVLIEIALGDDSASVVSLAIDRVSDREMLSQVAASTESPFARRVAERRLQMLPMEVTVSGTLVEHAAGTVPAGVTLQLRGVEGWVEATTDAQGRFSATLPARPGQTVHFSGCESSSVEVAGMNRIELGAIEVCNDALVTRTFGSLCGTGSGRTPASDLLLFVRERGGGWRHRYQTLRELHWEPPWKAVLCIEEEEKVRGHYYTQRAGQGRKVGPAYRTIWRVRLVQVEGGKAFRTKITVDPPGTTRFTSARGNPLPSLRAWLRTIQPGDD